MAPSHYRGNHLAAAGRLVKVPAFVLMYAIYIGPSGAMFKCGEVANAQG